MILRGLDPAPRSYARYVTAVRRSTRGPAAAPDRTDPAGIERWLLGPALEEADAMLLIETFLWILRAAGIPLDRASFHVGTLHPQIAGYAWNWRAEDRITDEVIVGPEARSQEAYLRNPLAPVFDRGETARGNPQDEADRARFPLFEDLAPQGVTDYVARPIGRRGRHYNAGTYATTRPGGFTAEQVAAMDRLYDLFALHLERHISEMIARNVAGAYLGSIAAGEVLQGAIARGAGRPIRAVIWVSDLRGYSERADRMEPGEVTAMLNLYFGALSGAAMEAGGEVLKFVGDGLLAVFPTKAGEAAAARTALAAARDGLARVEALNAAPPPELVPAALPLRSGLALHLGEVFFGNVGAPDRLDFTVIGRAVNEASRVETLTKALARPLLLTQPVAALVGEALEDMGEHALRGVGIPVRLFAG